MEGCVPEVCARLGPAVQAAAAAHARLIVLLCCQARAAQRMASLPWSPLPLFPLPLVPDPDGLAANNALQGDQFAGVFSPESDWQAPSQEERSSGRSSGRGRGGSGSGDWGGDSWRGDSPAGEAGSSGGAEAAFQPGQEVRWGVKQREQVGCGAGSRYVDRWSWLGLYAVACMMSLPDRANTAASTHPDPPLPFPNPLSIRLLWWAAALPTLAARWWRRRAAG